MRPNSGAPIAPAKSPGEAILQGNLAQVRYLLELGHGPNDRLDSKQAYQTPLMLCAYVTDKIWAKSVASCLLEKGGLVGLRDRNGLNALHYACIYEADELVQLFLNAADYDLNQSDRFGNTALHYAARSGSFISAKLLIDKLKNFGMTVDKQNRKGFTPLVQAWSSGNVEVAEYLLDTGGADPNIKDINGVSAFEHEKECRQRIRAIQHNDYNKLRMKQTRFDDIHAWKLKQDTLDKNKRQFRFKTWTELKQENEKNKIDMPKDNEKFIIPIERKNARNNPTYIFKTKPQELFENGGMDSTRSSHKVPAKSLQSVSFASSNQSRTRSTSASHLIRFSEDKSRRSETSLANHSSDKLDGLSGKQQWKNQMMSIYDQYTFQCSPSYCQTVTSMPQLDDHYFSNLLSPGISDTNFNEKDLLESDSFIGAQKWKHGSQMMNSLSRFKNQKRSDRKVASNSQKPTTATDNDQSMSLNVVLESATAVAKFKKHSRGKHP